jgi:hypothetical protein
VDDVGLPGVPLLLDGTIELETADDGVALFDEVSAGGHTITIAEEGIAMLAELGFRMPEGAEEVVEIESGGWVALFFRPEAVGFVEVDLGPEDDASGDAEE